MGEAGVDEQAPILLIFDDQLQVIDHGVPESMQDFNLCGVAVYYVALATQPGLVRSR